MGTASRRHRQRFDAAVHLDASSLQSMPMSSVTTSATLRRDNIIAGTLHTLSAIAVLSFANDFSLPVDADYLAGAPGTTTHQLVQLFSIRMAWLIAAFFALSPWPISPSRDPFARATSRD